MLLFILALTSLASAAVLPVTDYRHLLVCPPGHVFDGNVCRSYFQLRSEGTACLRLDDLLLTKLVLTDEVICPLTEEPYECCLYGAYTTDCLSTVFLSLPLPPCREHEVQGAYNNSETCGELTGGLPQTGFMYNSSSDPIPFFPITDETGIGGKCPYGYYPTDSGKCMLQQLFTAYGSGVFEPVEKPVSFYLADSNNDESETNNFQELFQNSQKIPMYFLYKR